MATGDTPDMLARQLTLYPPGWAAESGGLPEVGGTAGTGDSPHPILDAVLSGFGALWSFAYNLIQYASQQMRVQTSTDGWLELAALDYFGPGAFPRELGELDASYAARIQANILPRGSDRQSISAAIEALTGQTPLIVEPWCPADTGVSMSAPIINGAGGGAAYYSNTSVRVPGRYGGRSHRLAYQCFIDTILPPSVGSAALGYFDQTAYFDKRTYYNDGVSVPPSEQAILSAIVKQKAEGVLIWIRFNAS